MCVLVQCLAGRVKHGSPADKLLCHAQIKEATARTEFAGQDPSSRAYVTSEKGHGLVLELDFVRKDLLQIVSSSPKHVSWVEEGRYLCVENVIFRGYCCETNKIGSCNSTWKH